MSSSGLIYAVIVGAWAAYLVPMWLRRQDELNESRPTERFSTAIRLLSGRAAMERRYAKDLRARSTEEGEHSADPDGVTGSVDVRAFAMPPAGQQTRTRVEPEDPAIREPGAQGAPRAAGARHPAKGVPVPDPAGVRPSAGKGVPRARKASSAEAIARARRSKVLARRRRTTVVLFLAFTLGAIVAAVGGLAFLWAPGVPAVLLSAYIAYLRAQERKRYTFTMDRRRAEVAAQRLRERQPRRRPPVDADADEPEDGPEPESDSGLSALAADRRALVEQTDHAEWVDQQRERQRRPGHGDSWDPVPVPLPTYVTAPVAPRATPSVDLGAPDAWSSARSSTAETAAPVPGVTPADAEPDPGEPPVRSEERTETGEVGRSDARRAASARRSRERGRTPLFDQYEDGERPRAANE
ncbi:membrane protein [Streptomyces hygroscopicus]|uniref:divisome protein SepX/GlpR n=1 Tax=Streptomyces hygroscopicus TaxID=1912 RepID=UPI00223FF122|nr:gephyrin-like molybdotransferase receptor GlpR [Streptomyces hygroscopicus]MCW7947087.1 membrane protein [Streptomyces hygroscopicus]